VESASDDSEKAAPMNILFAHEISYLRDPIWELHTLSEVLSLRGHNVYIIDYNSTWEQGGSLVSRYQEMDIARAYPDAKVRLIRPPFLKIPVISRLSYSLIYYYVVIEKVLRDKKIDVVILYSVPTNGVQTILAAKKLGIPVIFRSIDVLHQLVKNPVLARITRQMEKWVYKRVDKSLCITPALKRHLVDLGATGDRCNVLPLGVDTAIFHPMDEDKGLRHRLGFDENDKIIVFVGTLPRFSGLDIFIRQLTMIPNVKLLIVGDGEQRPELERIIDELGLGSRVMITGMVAHDEVPRYINLASVCINPFPVSDITRDIFPTKVLLYMACGKPVVSSPLDGLKEMGIGVEQGVMYAEDGDFVSPIIRAMLHSGSQGKQALDYAVENHDYGRVVKDLERELVTIIGNRRINSNEHNTSQS